MNLETIKATIINVPNFPKAGINFKDITPLFLEPQKVQFIVDQMALITKDWDYDTILAPESRGFLFAVPLALQASKKLVLVRKKNKLPRKCISVDCHVEYGSYQLEVVAEDVKPNSKILILDDVIATGGTAIAIQQLCQKLNSQVVGQIYLIELKELTNHQALVGKFHSLIQY